MDRYYSALARAVLSNAEAEIIKAENYLLDAKTGDYLLGRAARLLRMARKLQDEIHQMAMGKEG